MSDNCNNVTYKLSSSLQCGPVDYLKKTYKFCCKKCDFYSNKSSNYLEHLKTKKHQITIITNPVNGIKSTGSTIPNIEGLEIVEKTDINKIYPCKNCNKPYNSKKGLWQHNKKCKFLPLQTSSSSEKTPIEIMTSTMLEMFKTNQEHMLQMIGAVLSSVKPYVNNNIVSEIPGNATSLSNRNVSVSGNMNNTNNSNNKTFNLNMFLNEQCKDAMNMTEFVETIQIDTDDMADVGKYGFVKGISNIFITNLEKNEVNKRPIHCSDIKREILYIKEDDKWEKDNISSKKMMNAVRAVEHKNISLVNRWAKENPECENSDTLANRMYMKLSKGALDGDDENIIKVIQKVAQNVTIDKNEYSYNNHSYNNQNE